MMFGKLLTYLGAVTLTTLSANAITLGFSSLQGVTVQFNGDSDTFTFLPASSGNQFSINVSDGAQDSVGAQGRIDGSWTIGSIASLGGFQTAAVTGTGTLTVHDGAGEDLTASLVWKDIFTFGSSSTINVNGQLNLSSVHYSGGKEDLKALAAPGVGTETISFTFTPGKSLTDLTANGTVNSTTFSGSLQSAGTALTVAVPDLGSTAMLLGMTIMGLGTFRNFRRSTKA